MLGCLDIMKKLLIIALLCSFVFCAFAAEEVQNHFIPLAGMKYVQTDSDDYLLSPSGGLQYMRIMPESRVFSLAANSSYNYYHRGFGEDGVKSFHGVSLMSSYNSGKNSFTAMIGSQGEVPFSDIKTVSGALIYCRQIVQNDNFTFIFGGGLVAADFDLTINDFDLYVLPVPVFSLGYKNSWLNSSLSFMGAPTLHIVLFPNAMFRFDGTAALAGVKSARDISFDCALKVYPFINTKAGELVGFSAGVMNSSDSFILKNKDEYGLQYYCAYGEVSATFITLRCGYNFNGVKLLNKEITDDLYNGIYASASAMLYF